MACVWNKMLLYAPVDSVRNYCINFLGDFGMINNDVVDNALVAFVLAAIAVVADGKLTVVHDFFWINKQKHELISIWV